MELIRNRYLLILINWRTWLMWWQCNENLVRWRIPPIDNLSLLLNKHRHVHEHLVQLLDRRLQLHEHLVSEEQSVIRVVRHIYTKLLIRSLINQMISHPSTKVFYPLPFLNSESSQKRGRGKMFTVVRCHWWLPWAAPHCPLYGYVLSVVPLPLPKMMMQFNLTLFYFDLILI